MLDLYKYISCILLQVFDDINGSEYQTLVESLGLKRPQTADLLRKAAERRRQLLNKAAEVAKQLKLQRGKSDAQGLTGEETKDLNKEEHKQWEETRNAQNEADRNEEKSLLMKVWHQHEKELERQEQENGLREILQSATANERDRILAEFNSQTRQLETRNEGLKQEQGDKVVAKLAARKRIREDLERDRAVNKELDHITKTHVSVVHFSRITVEMRQSM